MQKIKKLASKAGIVIGIFLGCIILAYAASQLFFLITGQRSDFTIKDYWSFELSDVFTEGGEIGPGDEKSINPVITSKSTTPSYVVIYVEMPLSPDEKSGLYEVVNNSDWTLVESGEKNGSWYEAYRYDSILEVGASTTRMADKVRMKDIALSDYVSYDNYNITMTGYAVGDGTELDTAWPDVKTHWGL